MFSFLFCVEIEFFTIYLLNNANLMEGYCRKHLIKLLHVPQLNLTVWFNLLSDVRRVAGLGPGARMKLAN